jgi:hypothetical protein
VSGKSPQTPQEYAQHRVEQLRTIPIDLFGQPIRFLNSDDGERFAAHAVAQLIALQMIDKADAMKTARDGDPLFQHALGILGVPLPYRPKRLQTARKRETNYFRDIALTMVVQELEERFGVKPTTSSKAGHGNCGCGIVAEAVGGLSYDAVAKVWGRLGKQI